MRSLDLRVVRLGGRSDYRTAVNVAKVIDRLRPEGVRRTLVLTSEESTAVAGAASAAAGASHGAVLFTDGSRMPGATRSYLRNHRPASVYAVGRPATQARPGLADNRKLVGGTRFATAVKVAQRFLPRPSSVAIASRRLDAALAGSYGADREAPVLLVRRNGVPRVVAGYIRRNRSNLGGSVLVGDPSAVSDRTFDRLLRQLTPRG